MKLLLSIDQDNCTSCGKCPDIAPRFFYLYDGDYIAYVKDNAFDDPAHPTHKGVDQTVEVMQESDQADVIEAAEECPGECIYVTEESARA